MRSSEIIARKKNANLRLLVDDKGQFLASACGNFLLENTFWNKYINSPVIEYILLYKGDFTGNLKDEIKRLRVILEVIFSFESHLEKSNIKIISTQHIMPSKFRIFCN